MIGQVIIDKKYDGEFYLNIFCLIIFVFYVYQFFYRFVIYRKLMFLKTIIDYRKVNQVRWDVIDFCFMIGLFCIYL